MGNTLVQGVKSLSLLTAMFRLNGAEEPWTTSRHDGYVPNRPRLIHHRWQLAGPSSSTGEAEHRQDDLVRGASAVGDLYHLLLQTEGGGAGTGECSGVKAFMVCVTASTRILHGRFCAGLLSARGPSLSVLTATSNLQLLFRPPSERVNAWSKQST